MFRQTNTPPVQWIINIDSAHRKELQFFQDRYPVHYDILYNILRYNPNQVIPNRLFPLRGKKYHHAWEYKENIPEGTFRIFYKLISTEHKVLVYYIGPKPNKVPLPPH